MIILKSLASSLMSTTTDLPMPLTISDELATTSNVSLHNVGCFEYMSSIQAGSVDAIITDLPYGTTKCAWDTPLNLNEMWSLVWRVLKPSGVFITTATNPFTSVLIASQLPKFRRSLVWDKGIGIDFLNANRHPLKCHEDIVIMAAGNVTYNPQFNTGKPYNAVAQADRGTIVNQNGGPVHRQEVVNTGTRHPMSVVRFKPEGGKVHATQKPLALYEWLVKSYSNKGDKVLDICAGAGTTLLACANTGRVGVGCELDPEIYATAIKRLRDSGVTV